MTPRDLTRRVSPLTYPAVLLSTGSLIWTSWSLIDLLGVGAVGVTVAAGADVIWASVIVAEYRGLRLAGKRWTVPALGWATMLTVAVFLAWHGIEKNAPAMAVAGPFLPLGAKAVWMLALADMRDPAALTDDEKYELAVMERGMAFEEAQHKITMRRRSMTAELQMAEVSTDFDIELTRQDKARELHRRRPLAVEPATAPDTGHHDTAPGHRDTGHHDTTPRHDATVPVLPRGPRRDTTRHTPAIDTNTPPARPAPVTPAAAQHHQPQPQPRKTPARSGQPSVKQVILEALREGVDVDDKATLRARVEQTLGPIKEGAGEGEVKADTWRTSYRRAVKEVEEGTGQYL